VPEAGVKLFTAGPGVITSVEGGFEIESVTGTEPEPTSGDVVTTTLAEKLPGGRLVTFTEILIDNGPCPQVCGEEGRVNQPDWLAGVPAG